MGALKRFAGRVGRSHVLAGELWATGWYEARTLAAFMDEPAEVTEAQMDRWAHDFDSWAICDTTCFHLFDRTPFAWARTEAWVPAPEEFVRRAGFALIWALSAHDKKAPDERFRRALELIEAAEPDARPLVKKAMDMALRATGKRNAHLNRAASDAAERMAGSENRDRAWIGKHALRELSSVKVRSRFAR
jgi:3-methyladenine DNA glycosylase AlkD